MADGTGLSIGATNLTAVHVGRAAVTRSPVLTRYPHRPSEVGVPGENPNLTERGLILTDFVDRVGDPVGIVAADGSSHRGEMLVAEALGALLTALTGGHPAGPVAVTHPAHWRPHQVDALHAALGPELHGAPLLADATAALGALRDDPGVPTHGIIAVCDFGGSGTGITLADADNGYRPIAPTVRHPDLSGALIDQALLTHVVKDLSAAGTIDLSGTSAIGSLSLLRGECRRAKERLSTASVTALIAELPGHRTDVRVTRNELDEVLRAPLVEFVAVLQDTLERNGVPPGALAAVATIGGGARIPAITTTLSEHLRVPVITAPQPELTAAIGGGLIAARGTVRDDATALAPAAEGAVTATMASALIAPEPPAAPQALAWSDADDVPDVAPPDDFVDDAPDPGSSVYGPRPQVQFADPEPALGADQPWYRRRATVVGAGAAAVLAVIAAVALAVNRDDGDVAVPASTSTPVTTTEEAPPPPPPAAVEQPAPAQTVTEVLPAPETVVQTVMPPPVEQPAEPPAEEPAETPAETTPPTSEPPPTTTEAPPASEEPPTTEVPTSTPPRWSPTAPYPTIPGLPWVPAPQLPGGQGG